MESSEEDQPNYFEASDGSWRDYVGVSVILVLVTMDLHSNYIFCVEANITATTPPPLADSASVRTG